MTDNAYPFADPVTLFFAADDMARTEVRVSTLGIPTVIIHLDNADVALRLTDQQVAVNGHVLADFLIRLGQQVRDQLNDWQGELECLQDGGGGAA